MEQKIQKYSAWGIVVHPKTGKIILTKKLAKKKYAAKLRKTMYQLLDINPEKAIKKFKLWTFTKGKIEENDTIEQTALKEILEEWGIKEEHLIQHKYLGKYTKQKKYGTKEIDMFLYILTKEYEILEPTDKRHIATYIDIHQVEKYMQNEDEKAFFIQIKNEIIQTFLAYQDIDPLSMQSTTDVTQIDAWIVR